MKKLQKKNDGFTIIEVLIVLAIAGLILLIVFLAVPALQRNSRNTQRKNDVGRLGSVATEFVSNNNGKLPSPGEATLSAPAVPPDPATSSNDAGKIVVSAGNLSQYDFTSSNANAARFEVADGDTSAVSNPDNTDEVTLATGAKCGTDGASTPGSGRQMALLYTIETSSGKTPLCTEV